MYCTKQDEHGMGSKELPFLYLYSASIRPLSLRPAENDGDIDTSSVWRVTDSIQQGGNGDTRDISWCLGINFDLFTIAECLYCQTIASELDGCQGRQKSLGFEQPWLIRASDNCIGTGWVTMPWRQKSLGFEATLGDLSLCRLAWKPVFSSTGAAYSLHHWGSIKFQLRVKQFKRSNKRKTFPTKLNKIWGRRGGAGQLMTNGD